MALFKPGSIQPDNVTDRGKVERVKLSGPGDTTETTEWIDVATQAELDTHAAAVDPHPGYLTPAEGNAAYQPLDTDLTAIAALVSAADKFAYATGAGTWAIADLTAAGRAILDDAAAVNQRTTLGLRRRPHRAGRYRRCPRRRDLPQRHVVGEAPRRHLRPVPAHRRGSR